MDEEPEDDQEDLEKKEKGEDVEDEEEEGDEAAEESVLLDDMPEVDVATVLDEEHLEFMTSLSEESKLHYIKHWVM